MANQLRITYERELILGRGAYGAVFKGTLFTEKENKQVQVAVKRIQKDMLSSQNQSEDRELTNQLKLDHPNVVKLLHWEENGDFRLYALELCIVSLDKVYKDQTKYRRLVPSQFEFMLQLSHGLEYIHGQNLIHRDIKPENVLISKSLDGYPLVKWADFGLSKAMTRAGECSLSGQKGTQLYWAPEIWRIWNKEDITDKKMMSKMSDIFSSGCVFFEFCTDGIHPFGKGEIEIKTNLSMEPSNPCYLKGSLVYTFITRTNKKTLNLALEESHFAYEMIKKILENGPERRPNSVEIISSLLTMGKPVQIISFDDERKLRLNREELEKIVNNQKRDTELPIAVLSVVGAYRTGKSFLLSWIIRYLQSHFKDSEWLEEQCKNDQPLSQGFKWKCGPEPETHGIWAWSEIFTVDTSSGQKIGVMLIDTQGLFDANNTLKQNGAIFTLSTLMSSIQIFNLSQRMQEDNLGNLQLFSEFGRLALTKGHSKSSSSMKPFQRIVFLIRDWPYPKKYPYGSQGGKHYLEEYLNITDERDRELSGRRRHIRQCFDQVDCFLMPHPGMKVANDQDGFDGRFSEMENVFKEHLGSLLSFIFYNEGVQPKTLVGCQILASDVADYVESYVGLLNSDGNLTPVAIFEATAKVHNNNVARESITMYSNHVIDSLKDGILLSDQEMSTKHKKFKKRALEYFYQHQMNESEINNSEILQHLNQDIEKELEHWKKRNELVKADITRLNESALQNAQKLYTMAMDDWFKSNLSEATPFFRLNQLRDQHHSIKESVKIDARNKWEGRDFITYEIRLQEFMSEHFIDVVLARNDEKKREEEVQLESVRREKEQANIQEKYELEVQMKLQEVNLKHEIELAKLRADDAERRADDAERRAVDAERRAADAERKASDAETGFQFNGRRIF